MKSLAVAIVIAAYLGSLSYHLVGLKKKEAEDGEHITFCVLLLIFVLTLGYS